MSTGTYRTYDENGVRFRYPTDWELSRDEYPDRQTSITVQSGGAAFWSLSMFELRPSAEHVADSTVEAFRQEYADLDEYPASGTLCGEPCAARDLEFMYADLVSTARIRALRTGRMTVLVLSQCTDQEEDVFGEQLREMTDSLEVTFGDDIEIS